MQMNPVEKARLLRESPWPNAQSLAEELYAMASDEARQEFKNGIHLQTTDPDIPLVTAQVFSGEDEVPVFSFNDGVTGPQTLTFSVAGSNLGGFNFNGSPVTGPESPGGGGGGGGDPTTFSGTVSSGTGSTYQVLLNNGLTVEVTQLQIDASETIPAGTSVIVHKIGGTYRMQVPVWLT